MNPERCQRLFETLYLNLNHERYVGMDAHLEIAALCNPKLSHVAFDVRSTPDEVEAVKQHLDVISEVVCEEIPFRRRLMLKLGFY